MSNSFQNIKRLRFTITLALGTFADGTNQVILEGFRSIVDVQKGGGQMMSSCTLRIFGLSQSLMAQLTTLAFLALSYTKNVIKIEAVDGDKVDLVYIGAIINAWGDYSTMPDVSLYIETQTGFFDQVKISEPLAFKGVANVADLMQTLANKIGVAFENNNVVSKIQNPNYNGTIIDQLRNLAQDTQTEFYLDDTVLAICPKGIARTKTKIIPIISSETGLIGYPSFDKVGVTFRVLFNAAIRFGGQIEMRSEIPQANGTWQVVSINHNLESEKPDGQWFSTIRCTSTGLTPL